jgi:hypothetical protein
MNRNTKWTFEKLQDEALKYKTRVEFQRNSKTAYNLSQRKNILEQVCFHMPKLKTNGINNPNFKWSYDQLKIESLKYSSRADFRKNNYKAYSAAWRNGILDDICKHMEYKIHYWTDEALAQEALKYKTRNEFAKNSPEAYQTAYKRKILEEICVHAPKMNGTSIGEKEIFEFIKHFYPDTLNNTKKIISPLELDIYIPSLNFAVEYCGLYWHSEEYKDKKAHYDKMKMCNEKGIRLITIFEDEWLERQDQVKNFLLSSINKNSIRLMGRKTEIKEVPKTDATAFLEQHHIQGSPLFEVAFGLYHNEELQAIITGNKHHRQGFDHLFVLNRLAFKSDVSISGGSSKLLKALLNYAKNNNYSKLISWSDNRWSEGNVYNKLGFELTEELGPDYSYVKKQSRVSKQSCKKKNLLQKGAQGTMENTERELALTLGLWRIWDCGKKRWEIDL